MKRKMNLTTLTKQELTNEEKNAIKGGLVVAGKKWAWELDGWCWCGSRSCGNSSNAVEKAHNDSQGDRRA